MFGDREKWNSKEARAFLKELKTVQSQTSSSQSSSSSDSTDCEDRAKSREEPIAGPSQFRPPIPVEKEKLQTTSSDSDTSDGDDSLDASSSSSSLSGSSRDSLVSSGVGSLHTVEKSTGKVSRVLITKAARRSTPAPAASSAKSGRHLKSRPLRKPPVLSTRRSRSRTRRVRGGGHWKKAILAAEKSTPPESTSSESSGEETNVPQGSLDGRQKLRGGPVTEPIESSDQVPGSQDSVPDSIQHGAAGLSMNLGVAEEPQAGPSNAGGGTWKPKYGYSLKDELLKAAVEIDTLISDHQDPDFRVTRRKLPRILRSYFQSLQQEVQNQDPINGNNEPYLDFSAQVATEYAALLFMFDEPKEEFKVLKKLWLKLWNEKVCPESTVSKEEADRIYAEIEALTIARSQEMASEIAKDIEDLKEARTKSLEYARKKTELAEKVRKHREALENGNQEVIAEDVPLNTRQLMKMLSPAFATWKIDEEPNDFHEAVLLESKRWPKKDLDLLKANTLHDCKYKLSGFDERAKGNEEVYSPWSFESAGPVVKATKIAMSKRLKDMEQDLESKFQSKYGKNWAKTKGEVTVPYRRRFPYHHGFVEVEAVPEFQLSARDFKRIVKEEKDKIKNWKYQSGADEEISDLIDWEDVADDMSVLLRKRKTAADCKQAYKQLVHPSLSNAPWTDEERERLRVEGETAAKGMGNWEEVVKNFPGRSVFQCIQRYRLDDVARNKVVWTDEMDAKLLEYIGENGPNLVGACYHLGNHRLNPDDILYRWSRHVNPILRKGDFTILEDVILILYMVKLRQFLYDDWNFGIIMHYLPWRYETTWRDRAEMLFADFIVPWTKEEDQLLLDLAKQTPGKWSKISKSFDTHKTRKNCASRYKRLMEQIGNGPGQFKSLDEYHIKYQMYRKKSYESNHLRDVLEVLKWLVEQTSEEFEEFPGLEPSRPPQEWEFKWLLIKFDHDVIKEAIDDLTSHLELRADSCPASTNPNDMKTCDRRTFKRNDPQSVASALHFRGIKLKRPEDFTDDPMNAFENQVWIHYSGFAMKKFKADKQRRNIPSRAVLINLPEVKRIVIREEFDVSGDEYEYVALRRGRPKKVVSSSATASNSTSAAKSRRTASRAKKMTSNGTTEIRHHEVSPEPGPSSAVPKYTVLANKKTTTQKKHAAKLASKKRKRQNASGLESEPVSLPKSKKGKVSSASREKLKRKRNSQKKPPPLQDTTTDFETDESPKARKTKRKGLNQPPVATIGRILRPRK